MIEVRRFARLAMPLGLAALLGAPLFADNYDKKTDVTFSEPVQVPGTVLQPGKYIFILLNSSSNRHIVEVKSEDGKHLYAMFMTTAAHRIEPSDKVTINYYEMPAGTPMAIRQWYWPGDLDGQEFLYSHKDAAAIAQAAKQKVSEASEEDLAAAKLPDNDTDAAASQSAQSSTLQSSDSSSAAVSTTDSTQQSASISTQQQSASTQSSNNEFTAQAATPAPAPADTDQSNNTVAQVSPAPAPSASIQTAPSDTAQSNSNSDSSTLPQTASDLPALSLIGLAFLATGIALKFAGRGIQD